VGKCGGRWAEADYKQDGVPVQDTIVAIEEEIAVWEQLRVEVGCRECEIGFEMGLGGARGLGGGGLCKYEFVVELGCCICEIGLEMGLCGAGGLGGGAECEYEFMGELVWREYEIMFEMGFGEAGGL
jgi:hypothetical protein